MLASPAPGPIIEPQRLAVLEQCSRLFTTNPFDPAWEKAVRAAVGPAYRERGADDWVDGPLGPNRAALHRELTGACVLFAWNWLHGATPTERQIELYVTSVIFGLWDAWGPHLQHLIDTDAVEVPFYDDFVHTRQIFLEHVGLPAPAPGHLLALFYQARRAWFFAATRIRGRSARAASARASIWRAVFGSDLCAYADAPDRLDALPVLITGETGTGKDLAAHAIGLSRYLPFDASTRRFAHRYGDDFHARNLCELPADLLPASLFGHKKGAFTGATADAEGFFSLPGPHGVLFLDEIGELPEDVQVKLLRPLQNREYVPVGERKPRKIQGRLIFATHRNLRRLCREGKFREDLYERLNGVRIHMPPLREVLAEAPGELGAYVHAFVEDTVGSGEEADAWTERVVREIHTTGTRYAWPRNQRELKNYVWRYVAMGGEVEALEDEAGDRAPDPGPAPVPAGGAAGEEERPAPSSRLFGPRAKAGEVSLAELTRAYVTRMFVLAKQNKAEAARRLGVDWRTVGKMLDEGLLARLLGKPRK